MTHAAWNTHVLSTVALLFSNEITPMTSEDDQEWLFLMLNQSKEGVAFTMPVSPTDHPGSWFLELLTTDAETPAGVHVNAGEKHELGGESIALWSWVPRD
jgi:hypothetical protein